MIRQIHGLYMEMYHFNAQVFYHFLTNIFAPNLALQIYVNAHICVHPTLKLNYFTPALASFWIVAHSKTAKNGI